MVLNLQSRSQNHFSLLTTTQNFNFPHFSTLQDITPKIILAMVMGYGFNYLEVPAGWLLGSMIAGIFFAIHTGKSQPLPSQFMTLGKALIALTTASRFSPETLSIAMTYPLAVLVSLLLTALLSLTHGYFLSRWAGIDRVTGILSFIPGAASSIVAIAEEMGADAVAITLLQYIRVLLVMLIIPGVVSLCFPGVSIPAITAPIPEVSSVSLPLFWNLILLGFCCLIGSILGQKLRLPAAGFLGPFLIGILVFWTAPDLLEVPRWLFSIGLLCVGLSIGVKFNWQAVQTLWKAVLIDIGLVFSLIGFCFGVGYGFHLLTQIDTVTAILGLTPGGIEAMLATVMQMGGDTGLVLALQLTRMFTILLVAPSLVVFIIERGQKSHHSLTQK